MTKPLIEQELEGHEIVTISYLFKHKWKSKPYKYKDKFEAYPKNEVYSSIQKVLKELEKKKLKGVRISYSPDLKCDVVKWSDVVKAFGECRK